MKKIFILVFVLMTGLGVNAGEVKTNYFVMNTGEIMNCKKIQFRNHYIRARMENGAVLIIPVKDIKVIRANKKYYEKMPVYVNNVKTEKMEFMQFVTTRGGLKLYKYTTKLGETNGYKAFNQDGFNVECYVVYKSDQFYVGVTEQNYPTLLEFFNLSYSEI